MKIVEMKCPACGGNLQVDENKPDMTKCPYCNCCLAIEWEKGQEQKQEPKQQQIIVQTQGQPKEGFGWEHLWKLIAMWVVLIVCVMRFRTSETEDSAKTSDAILKAVSTINQVKTEETLSSIAVENTQKEVLTGDLGDLAAQIFEMPVEEIPMEELAKIKWLEMKYDFDYKWIGYSFDNPWDENAELTWVAFSRDSELGRECLKLFAGLVKLNCECTLQKKDIQGLNLESIGGYFHNPQALCELVENPTQLKEIYFNVGADSLEGIEQFSNLQRLHIGSSGLSDIKHLLGVPELKELTLEGFDSLSDFSVLGAMDSLEVLRLESENLKTIDFLQGMESLKQLEIADGSILTLNGLEKRSELEALSVSDCNELKNMDAVTMLSDLRGLSLELPYGCEEPDLSSLENLEYLKLSQFENCAFVEEMEQLKVLELDCCTTSVPLDFSKCDNLTELIYNSFAVSGQDIGFMETIPSLEKLDMKGVSTYEDISGIFNIKTLKHLDISGMECEINFERIEENQTLETLKMDSMILYENVQVSGGGGFMYVDWDGVTLDEHTDFFTKLKALKHLSVVGNQLTDLTFAENLGMLETIDMSDNYITELRPLANLKKLRRVVCVGNPISNEMVLSDKVNLVLE